MLEPIVTAPIPSCDPQPRLDREIALPDGVAIDLDMTAQGRLARASVLPATDPRIANGAVSGGLFVLLQNHRRLLVDATMQQTVNDIEATLQALSAFFPRAVLVQRLSFQLSDRQAVAPEWRECLADFEVSCSAPSDRAAKLPSRWLAIPATLIRSRCQPLGAEWSLQMLPGHRLLVAAYASPVVATLDMGVFSEGDHLHFQALQQSVFDTVVAADAAHDTLHWPTARAASDSYLQRRIAILPQGVARLIQRCGAAAWHAALKKIDEAAAAASLAVAHNSGVFPAMQSRQVLLGLMGREDYASWVHRWRLQTQTCRYRNRQLVAIDLADWWLGAPLAARDFALAAEIVNAADLVALGRQWPDLRQKVAINPEIGHRLWSLIKRRELATA